MFSYYGAKTKIVNYYPAPTKDTIIETFAGSARYSLKYFDRNVILYEIDDKVYRIWKYLQEASVKDILSLPNAEPGVDLRTIESLTIEEKWLIGFQGNRGAARPNNIMSIRSTWAKDRERISKEIHKIKHWSILKKNAMDMPIDDNITYFIDPPYTVQIHGYTHKSVDYNRLAKIVNNINSEVIVCGNENDTWLDFSPLKQMMGTSKKHVECAFIKGF
jgi:site-specific DNA-adenine methylase